MVKMNGCFGVFLVEVDCLTTYLTRGFERNVSFPTLEAHFPIRMVVFIYFISVFKVIISTPCRFISTDFWCIGYNKNVVFMQHPPFLSFPSNKEGANGGNW
jgi:hypothetical protein